MKDRFNFLTLIVGLVLAGTSMAAHHQTADVETPNLPQAIQIQLCNLNDGKSLADYDRMTKDYFTWSKKNGVAVDFVRHTPLFSHSNASNPGYDFVEYLISSHEISGESWDKWLNTKEGQKLNDRWQSIATCHVKMGTLHLRYVDEEANQKDDDRIVTMDWCTRKDGISWEQLTAKHDQIEASYPEGVENIVWGVMIPQVGAADAPGEFAHVNVFPDMQAFMARQKWLSHQQGWKLRADYTSSYADCTGESASVESVLNRINP